MQSCGDWQDGALMRRSGRRLKTRKISQREMDEVSREREEGARVFRFVGRQEMRQQADGTEEGKKKGALLWQNDG